MLNQSGLDAVFQALADPTRRNIVERLSQGAMSVSQLAEPLDMSLPAVLQHLHVLEASGIVRSEKAGRVRTCRVESGALEGAESWLAGRRATWEKRFDRLEELLGAPRQRGGRRRKP
jgi:DNA-binding transcriptional ArsR family regulator